MKYKVIRGFAGAVDGVIFSHGMGEILDESEIPEGADWIQAGFLEAIPEKKKPAPKRKKATGKKAS